jgi:hypothetical protein
MPGSLPGPQALQPGFDLGSVALDEEEFVPAGRTPKAAASATRAASVARPSTAGALTATTNAGP